MRIKIMIVALGTWLVMSMAPPAAGSNGASSADSAVPIVTPSKPDEVKSVNGTNAPPVSRATRSQPSAGQAAVSWPKAAGEVVTTSAPSTVAVRKLDRGLSISVRRAAGDVVRGPVRLTVDYSQFRDAFGGDWASRLRLVKRDGSRAGGVRNDVRSGKLAADVPLGAAEEHFVLAAAPEGGNGDYKATSLAPSGKWQVSPHTGAFAWSYDLRMPPVPGDLAPELSASYNSNAVDGRTVSTNSQPSWVGEGWSLWPGFIERSYKGCADDLGGNNGTTKTGDLCWETENATLSFGDRSGPLVLQGGTWRLKDDDGTKVQHDGGSWKLTTTDGTQYFYGRRTDSAWTVPVFGNDGGEPCHVPGNFDGSQCDQVYRWNLDQVVDRHGNSMSFFYREETNLYGANNGRRGASYTRGGTVERIEYGTRDGVAGQAPARVWFDVADRCLSNCGVRNASTWPDVPWDQECTSGTCAGKVSPTFWSTKRLSAVTTQVSTGGGSYRSVDQWAFAHSFPSPGDGSTAGLWLTGITRTGLAATPSVTLPPVSFEGTMYRNRVDSGPDGLPGLHKNRITTIRSESGGEVNVVYAATECAPGATPPVDTNTKRCFPVRWVPPMESVPRDDWFHKYTVSQITEHDAVGGNVTQVTNYDYAGGGAWAYDDNPLIDPTKRTWSEWRGYEKVVVRKGDPLVDEHKPESWTQHQYFRGMHGDKLKAGGTKPVNITDSRNVSIADEPQFAGFERETIVKNGIKDGVVGPEVTGEIHTPWSRLTATQDTQGTVLKAHQVEDIKSETRTRLSDGSYRNTRVETSYDEHGNAFKVKDAGDIDNTTDDRCTNTTYVKNLATMVVDLPATVTTTGVACGSTPSFPADAITDSRAYYDGGDINATPTKGDVTKTEVARDYNGSAAVYLNGQRTTYDGFGRMRESDDPLNRKTTNSYTETNGLTTATAVTNPLQHTATTTVDPAWGLPTRVVDANNRVTTLTYDALGRLTAVWKPGRSQVNGDSPHLRATYQVRNDGPSWIRTDTLKANQNHVASFTLLDGFLRERQTQAPSPRGGRVLTDVLYDSRGLVNVKRAAYYHKDAPPGTTLFLPVAGEVPNSTVQVYDGAERETDAIYLKLNVEQWRARTYHGGDRVTVVPPDGGTATTTVTDARGQTTELLQDKTRPVSGPPAGAADRTTYGYTKRGELASVTDPAGNVWRHGYDVLGRRVKSDNPDHGVSTMTYDDAGQLRTATEARGKRVAAVYDNLGRKTETWLDAPVSGTLITKSVYDTLSKGALTSSTRFAGGNAYTKAITGYDAAGLPTGETVTIPPVEAELAGTYTIETTFTADGSPATTKLPRLTSTFGPEALVHTYDDLGQPDKVTGSTTYVSDTVYTALGEPTQVQMGVDGKRLWRTTYREEGTRRVNEVLTERELAGGAMLNDLTYAYDPIGNITKIGDRTAGYAADTQCYRYDYLRRTTSAWTATDNCAAAPSTSVIGGPAPYWHQFSYDLTGNRKSHTRKGLAGAADQTSTYTYPTSGDGADRPHAVSSIQTGAKTDSYGYDAAGNTITRPNGSASQTLEWNEQGQLDSITSTQGRTSYLYDADGQQLIRRDPGSVTLFVGGGEVTLDTITRTETGTRNYEDVGTRTSGGLTWLVADHHGTSQLAIDASTMAVTPRRLDLFGNPRSTGSGAAAMATWPGGNRGFVGGVTNDASGLTRLGAREYDPALGKFISADPITDPANPQQMNGYSYANNNPVTFSDPTGLFCDSCEFWDHRDGPDHTSAFSNVAPIQGERSAGYFAGETKKQQLKQPVKVRGKKLSEGEIKHLRSAWSYRGSDDFTYEDALAFAAQGGGQASLVCSYFGGSDDECGLRNPNGINPLEVLYNLTAIADIHHCIDGSESCWNLVYNVPGGKLLKFADEALDAARAAGKTCNSFTPGTLVQMADGTQRPIEKVKVGDQVLATDPETGKTQARPVVALISGMGQKELVELTIDIDGKAGTKTGKIVATDEHPFWSPTLRRWVDAEDLRPGHFLRTGTGTWIQVTATRTWTQPASVHNLTISGIHTYYVLAGTRPVLVHNDNCLVGQPLQKGIFGQSKADLERRINEVVDFYDMHGRPPALTHQGKKSGQPAGQYGNDNGRLPTRTLGFYTESDVWPSAMGTGSRGAERLVFGQGGEVYYTADHYDNFIRLR